MRNKSNIKIIILALGIFIAVVGITNYSIFNDQDGTVENRGKSSLKIPKISEFWPNCPPIHIQNDNWSATPLPWIQIGLGTEINPHIIENLTINGRGAGNGIFIENSNDYFIVRNCTIYNCSIGIRLDNTNYGTLTNNNCSNNNDGIGLNNNCHNNTISENFASNNSQYGIYLENCNNNLISENILDHNQVGIFFLENCMFNTILRNTVNTSEFAGIMIVFDGDNNLISENFVSNNSQYGILLDGNNNLISENFVSNNSQYGIYLDGNNNLVSENFVSNNGEDGIYLYGNDNLVSENFVSNNGEYGILASGSINVISGNTIIDNGIHGILAYGTINVISGNTIINNGDSGIYLTGIFTSFNVISENFICENHYGINLYQYAINNDIFENFIYYNTNGAIYIYSTDTYDNEIIRNVLVSKNDTFVVYDGDINDISVYLNYELRSPPRLNVTIINQLFSMTEFNIIINVFSEVRIDFSIETIQILWNDILVPSKNITKIGKWLYNLSLTPIFVNMGEEPILLNITISAFGYETSFFETYIAVDPDTLEKGIVQDGDEFLFLILITALISTAGGIGATIITIGILRKRKPTKEVI
ncbi:MAG: right-handed parallel beta-helix repeat-containing protein [Promethearchaeota archaeon]|nr:MAG: right-handed parallel beta-helix repeat-containing protein [Candidatus Lokiarchaeota archaeon]